MIFLMKMGVSTKSILENGIVAPVFQELKNILSGSTKRDYYYPEIPDSSQGTLAPSIK
jgi:hypothetical protein